LILYGISFKEKDDKPVNLKKTLQNMSAMNGLISMDGGRK